MKTSFRWWTIFWETVCWVIRQADVTTFIPQNGTYYLQTPSDVTPGCDVSQRCRHIELFVSTSTWDVWRKDLRRPSPRYVHTTLRYRPTDMTDPYITIFLPYVKVTSISGMSPYSCISCSVLFLFRFVFVWCVLCVMEFWIDRLYVLRSYNSSFRFMFMFICHKSFADHLIYPAFIN